MSAAFCASRTISVNTTWTSAVATTTPTNTGITWSIVVWSRLLEYRNRTA